jgi:DNA-binding Xre family transcriptional regulator
MENNLKKLREISNVSLSELSKALSPSNKLGDIGISMVYIQQLEEGWGNQEEIPLSFYISICDYFNCSLDYLFKRTDMRVKI